MDKTREKLHNRIKRSCGKAIGDFNLIEAGDRIAVAVSGGQGFMDPVAYPRRPAPAGATAF